MPEDEDKYESGRDAVARFESWRSSARGLAARARFRTLAMSGLLLVYGGGAAIGFRRSLAQDFRVAPGAIVAVGIIILAVGLAIFVRAASAESAARAEYFEDIERKARGDLNDALAELTDITDLLSLMRANRRQMDAYDAIARGQADASYRASQVAMFAGLALLAFGVAVALFASEPATKYSAAFLTATGAAVGGYVARTFINVQQRAMNQLTFYFQQPLVQSYLLTAERVSLALPPADRKNVALKIVDAIVERLIPEPTTAKQNASTTSKSH